MNKIQISLNPLEQKILENIKQDENTTFKLIVNKMKEYNRSIIWKEISKLKRAGAIINEYSIYSINDGIKMKDIKEGKISIDINNLKNTFAREHKVILEYLKNRGKKLTKLALIINDTGLNKWVIIRSIDDLLFLGLVKKEERGLYRITEMGEKVLEIL